MPELPEVTVITQQLDKKLKGLVLDSIEYDWPKGFHWGKYSIADLKGMVVKNVERRGKVVIINLGKSLGKGKEAGMVRGLGEKSETLNLTSKPNQHPNLNLTTKTVATRNESLPWDPEVTRRWLPVDMYVGGAEHSVLHLLYSRFLTM